MAERRQGIGVGLVFGGIAGVTVGALIAWNATGALLGHPDTAAASKLVRVAVARQALAKNTALRQEHLSFIEIPERYATVSMVKGEHAALVAGQQIHWDLQAGQPLLWDVLEGGDPDEVAPAVGNKLRGFPVALPSDSPSPLIPGHEVDVLATFPHPETGVPVSTTVLEKVRIVGADWMGPRTTLPPSERRFHEVWLQVLPREAELLAAAQRLGRIDLVLRPAHEDTRPRNDGPVGVGDLLNDSVLEDLQRTRLQRARLRMSRPHRPG